MAQDKDEKTVVEGPLTQGPAEAQEEAPIDLQAVLAQAKDKDAQIQQLQAEEEEATDSVWDEFAEKIKPLEDQRAEKIASVKQEFAAKIASLRAEKSDLMITLKRDPIIGQLIAALMPPTPAYTPRASSASSERKQATPGCKWIWRETGESVAHEGVDLPLHFGLKKRTQAGEVSKSRFPELLAVAPTDEDLGAITYCDAKGVRSLHGDLHWID